MHLWICPMKLQEFQILLSDIFHKDVPDEFILKLFEVMNKAHWHTFQVLTKRTERIRGFLGMVAPIIVAKLMLWRSNRTKSK